MSVNYEPFEFHFIKEHRVYQGVYMERSFTITQELADAIAGMNILMQARKSTGNGEVAIEWKTANNTIVLSGLTLTIKMLGSLMNVQPEIYVYNMDAYNTADDLIKMMVGTIPIQQLYKWIRYKL